jgi:hypothetical protein
VKLHVVNDYRCREIHYEKGQVLEVAPAVAAALFADAPGCFSLVKAPDRPPADKMIRRSRKK